MLDDSNAVKMCEFLRLMAGVLKSGMRLVLFE